MALREAIESQARKAGLPAAVEGDGVGRYRKDVEANMADRVEALGGLLEVRSAPGSGTTVTGRVPVGGGDAR